MGSTEAMCSLSPPAQLGTGIAGFSVGEVLALDQLICSRLVCLGPPLNSVALTAVGKPWLKMFDVTCAKKPPVGKVPEHPQVTSSSA